jgi:hypothetical protein
MRPHPKYAAAKDNKKYLHHEHLHCSHSIATTGNDYYPGLRIYQLAQLDPINRPLSSITGTTSRTIKPLDHCKNEIYQQKSFLRNRIHVLFYSR